MTGLNDNEKAELKGLQEKRKETGGHITDSERTRLSELQGKNKATPAAEAAGGGGGGATPAAVKK